jgi:hypothetical protein
MRLIKEIDRLLEEKEQQLEQQYANTQGAA